MHIHAAPDGQARGPPRWSESAEASLTLAVARVGELPAGTPGSNPAGKVGQFWTGTDT